MGCPCEKLAGPGVRVSSVCVGSLWMFQNLQHDQMEALVEAAVRRKYSKGEAVFSQGGRADHMFLIKAGRVKLTKYMEDGGEMTLDIRKGGDVLGENMFSEEDGEYPLTAWCMEETLTCGFTREGFEQLILDHPKIGLQVIKNLSNRVTWLTSHVGSLSITNLEERLYGVLENVAREHGVKSRTGRVIQFPLTHEDLSFLAGAHRVSITRAMKALKESGRIIQEGRTLILPMEPGIA